MPEYRATAPGREITSLDFMQISTDLHGLPGGIKTRLDNFAIDVDALDKKGFHCQNSLWAVIAFIKANFKPLVTERDRYHKKLPNICAEQPLLLDHPFVSTPIPQDRKHRPCFAYRLWLIMLNVLTGQRGYANAKKLWLFTLSAMVLLLSGCMGGNSGSASSSMAPDTRTDQLYANIAATPSQLYAGFAIDTDNPVISSYTGQSALSSFLAKQPDISKFNRLESPPEYVNGAWKKGQRPI